MPGRSKSDWSMKASCRKEQLPARLRSVPRVAFTSSLQRHVTCPAESVEGGSVRSALDAYFARHPQVRSYVLDEQGALRHHVVVFVGSIQVRDRTQLADPVGDGDEIWVMQALSGG